MKNRVPPSATLFPYTTLFRSPRRWRLPRVGPVRARTWLVVALALGLVVFGLWVYAAVDRKSTRLNSSHVEISYAVFCLKKKIVGYNATQLCKKSKPVFYVEDR